MITTISGGTIMTAYTLTYQKTSYHQTTILAESKEDFLSKVAKLIFPQETPENEIVSLDDQDLEVETLHVDIKDVEYEEE